MANAAICIRCRSAPLKLILSQLILQDGDLIARDLRFGLCVNERGPRLIFAGAHLRVVEPRDHLAHRYGVALADGDLEDFPAVFGHCGIVAFNASTERNNAVRQTGAAKKTSQITIAATTTAAMRMILTTRERGALFSAGGGAPDAGGGVRCSAPGGA